MNNLYKRCSLALIAALATAGSLTRSSSHADEPGKPETVDVVPSNSAADTEILRHFVNTSALATAWKDLESSGVTDGALQYLNAEQVLGRTVGDLSAQEVFSLAVRLSLEKGDQDSLARLERGAQQAGRDELATSVVIARKAGGASRDNSQYAPVTPQDTNTLTFAAYRAFAHDIQAARLCGDARALTAIESDLVLVPEFNDQQQQSLKREIERAKMMASESTTLPDALDRLSSDSRRIVIHYQGIKSGLRVVPDDNYSSIDDPSMSQPRNQGATNGSRPRGEQLGRVGKSQSTSASTSDFLRGLNYEQRQQVIRAMRDPHSIKPSIRN